MKKTINLFLAAFVLVAAVSCVKENIADNNASVDNVSAIVTMTAPRAVSEAPAVDKDADTKTGLAEDGKTVVWKNGDKVDAVIWRVEEPSFKPYDYYALEMTCSLDADDSTNVIFTGEFDRSYGEDKGTWWRPKDSDRNPIDGAQYATNALAVYPSTVSYGWSGTTRVYSYDLPATQTPTNGTFQDDVALLSAPFNKTDLTGTSSTAPKVASLSFKNACALIRVNLPEFSGRNIVSVKVEGTAPMTGQPANLTESDGRLVPNGSWTSQFTYVELVSESAITDGTYYMVVWPGSHSKLTLTVTDADGWYWTKEVEGSYNFVESKVFNLNIDAANAEFADPSAREDDSTPKVGSYYYTDGTISLYHDLEGKTLAGVIFSVGGNYEKKLIEEVGSDITGLVMHKDHYVGGFCNSYLDQVVGLKDANNYVGYTATIAFKNHSNFTGNSANYLYGYMQSLDQTYPVSGGWYIPGLKEYQEIASQMTTLNESLDAAGLTQISTSNNYWYSYSTRYNVEIVTGSGLATIGNGGFYQSNYALLIAAFYKQKEWTPGEVTGVTLDHTSADIEVGGSTLTLTPTISAYGDVPATNSNVSWTSSAESIATVSNGVVTAVGEGTAVITVTTEDGGYQATCTVNVTDPTARKQAAVGDYVYTDGTWSDGTEDPTEGKTVAGIVCYIGDLSADTELMALNSNYNVIVAELSDYGGTNGKGIYEGATGDNHFWIGYNESKVDEYNRVTSQPGDKFFGYSLFYSWKICYENNWGAVKDKLMYGYDINDVINSASTCWYVASLGEYKAIRAMEQTSGLKLSGYTNLGNGDYATLYLDNSNGYVYDYNPITGAISTKSGTSSHWIRRVFATTLADHE